MAYGWLLFARRRGAAQCPSASTNVARPFSAVGRSVGRAIYCPFVGRCHYLAVTNHPATSHD